MFSGRRIWDGTVQENIHQRKRLIRNDKAEHHRVLFPREPSNGALGRKLIAVDRPNGFVAHGDHRVPEAFKIFRTQINQEVRVFCISRDAQEVHGQSPANEVIHSIVIQAVEKRFVIHPSSIPEYPAGDKLPNLLRTNKDVDPV